MTFSPIRSFFYFDLLADFPLSREHFCILPSLSRYLSCIIDQLHPLCQNFLFLRMFLGCLPDLFGFLEVNLSHFYDGAINIPILLEYFLMMGVALNRIPCLDIGTHQFINSDIPFLLNVQIEEQSLRNNEFEVFNIFPMPPMIFLRILPNNFSTPRLLRLQHFYHTTDQYLSPLPPSGRKTIHCRDSIILFGNRPYS
jgi:hypothetical protein